MGTGCGDRRAGRGPARIAARLRRQEHRAGGDRAAQDPLQRNRARGRAASRSAATKTSRRRCTNAAGRTGCRWCRRPRSACSDARRHRARPAGGDRADPAGAAAGDSREDRGQRGDGRVQAGIPAGGARRGRGGARGRLRDARRAGDDDVRRPGGGGQRRDPPPHRHERQGQCAGAGQPRQRRDRARLAAGDPQYRRRPPAGGRPRDARQPRQIHLLLRRG